jgi:murein DD-endopeptidase MepM/ murein hydrolase activator NlpD
MSRRKNLKARDKITLKNTRDGLIERNATTGEDIRISKRETDFDLRGEKPMNETYSQLGNSSGKGSKRKQVYRHGKTDSAPETGQSVTREAEKPTALRFAETQTAQAEATKSEYPADTTPDNASAADTKQPAPVPDGRRLPQKPPSAKSKPPPAKKRRYQHFTGQQTGKPDATAAPKSEYTPVRAANEPKSTQHSDGGASVQSEPTQPQKPTDGKRDSRLNAEPNSRLKFTPDETAPVSRNKQRRRKQPQQSKPLAGSSDVTVATETAQPTETRRADDTAKPEAETAPKTTERTAYTSAHTEAALPSNPGQGKTDAPALKTDKPGKLQFTPNEAAPDTPKIHHNRKLGKAQMQADRSVAKLEKARKKLPKKRKLRSERVFDTEKGKANRRLYFESEIKSQGQHMKGALPLRPVKAASNSALAFGHRKMFRVERENVATEAAHKGEMFVEGGIRSALRFRKTAPYRKVEKLERKAAKKAINLTYRKALAENPKLKSNLLSRAWQKRKIKKDYAKAAREAGKAAQQAKKAGTATGKAAKALAGVIRRHPVTAAVIILLALLIFLLPSLFSLGSGLGGGGIGGILTASYLAEDADTDNAELAYTEWEVDLQEQIANTGSTHSGYDEYRYNVGEISHNPYELMAYLTVMYQNFPYGAIESDLRTLFSEQYSLTFTPATETRYADPTDADDDGDYEPYEWRVMTVTLTARSFGDVALSHLSGEQLAHYALLLQTKGSRQYLGNPFGDMNWLPYVTSYYGYRIHPISGVKDLHRGVDIGLPTGTEIRAGQGGTVTFAGYGGDYGNVVVIEDANGLVSKYAHCDSLLVSAGQTANMGDVIATVGNTGNSTGSHLHLEVLKNGRYLNPLYFADTGSFNVTPGYGYAGAPMGDGSYAALIAEAERFLDFPYVWGGSSPETSFDCSGYISYILRSSGVKDVGRLGAQGLYNICAPVPPSEARPGDLIFFHSTYSAPLPVTHVGLYVGTDATGRPRMIHCGSPIQYTHIDTAYRQQHFYAYGRISSD